MCSFSGYEFLKEHVVANISEVAQDCHRIILLLCIVFPYLFPVLGTEPRLYASIASILLQSYVSNTNIFLLFLKFSPPMPLPVSSLSFLLPSLSSSPFSSYTLLLFPSSSLSHPYLPLLSHFLLPLSSPPPLLFIIIIIIIITNCLLSLSRTLSTIKEIKIRKYQIFP